MRHLWWAASVLTAVVWALLLSQEESSSPADSGRRRVREVRGNILRTDPLSIEDRIRGEALLLRVRENLHGFGRPSCVIHPSFFQQHAESGRRELRLFALGYPELAEAWAQRVLEVEPSSPDWERWAACSAFGILTEFHWGAARSVLLRKCKDPKSSALALLVHLEGVASYRELTLERAVMGQPWSIVALAELPDARTTLEELKSQGRGRWREPETAQALTCMNALASDDWEETARRTLLNEDDRRLSVLYWTLEIARKRKPAWLESTLRTRIGREYERGRVTPAGGGLEVESWVFDEFLLALWEIGASLSASERAYLQEHGYGVDPRARLGELLP